MPAFGRRDLPPIPKLPENWPEAAVKRAEPSRFDLVRQLLAREKRVEVLLSSDDRSSESFQISADTIVAPHFASCSGKASQVYLGKVVLPLMFAHAEFRITLFAIQRSRAFSSYKCAAI
jgi:hypothetical protein